MPASANPMVVVALRPLARSVEVDANLTPVAAAHTDGAVI